MTRKLREESPTGYYHVMTRGINKQIIFRDDKDRIKYLVSIIESLKKYPVKIICYCLMPNHTHLVIHDENKILSKFMHSLDDRYAIYFNNKYDRIGSLFQDRFRSECIKDERQLLAAYRYVLNNPYKAGMCQPWSYEWNSYSRYLHSSQIVDTTIISDILGDENNHKEFISSYAEDNFIDVES